MKVYNATFRKKDGTLREINFAELKDLPAGFLAGKIKGNSGPPPLKDGLRLVWDVDLNEFRIFNMTTVIGEVVEKEINFVL
jgi:hypothetical protein